ncbi:hypothetical protein TNCV_4007341 [Trichonephila clavipes]|nr:hypothetical protein TNCV_4007341 [Trichonephila clavipes]
MEAFRATGNVSKEKKKPLKTVRTHENVERVRVSIHTGLSQVPDLQNHSKTVKELRNNIREEIDNIPVDILENVTQSFRNRLHQYIDNGG